MKIALIINENSCASREYLSGLFKKNIKIDVIQIGKFSKNNISEDKRCCNLWKSDSVKLLSKFHNFFDFNSLKSIDLLEFLKNKKYDLRRY
tara:strand:- start:1039 stop:1311 length:273 start_codon:yes stop_codon:yes gene_type:complete